MCAPDPNAGIRRQARERNKARIAKYYGNSIKQWNKEADFKENLKNIRGLGRSRVLSDFQEFATRARGGALLGKENAAREMFQKQTVNEGGRSRTRGRGRTMEYFSKIADIDRKQFALATVGEAKLQQGLQQRQQAMERKERMKLGMGPQFGMPTMLPPKDRAGQFMNSLSFGLNVASGIMALPGVSDRRVKENIKEVGKSPDGYTIYEWNYKGEKAEERYRGVIAQDVVKINPMAVTVMENGLLGVYYDQLDVELEAA
mgnify:CR=1 FL=1